MTQVDIGDAVLLTAQDSKIPESDQAQLCLVVDQMQILHERVLETPVEVVPFQLDVREVNLLAAAAPVEEAQVHWEVDDLRTGHVLWNVILFVVRKQLNLLLHFREVRVHVNLDAFMHESFLKYRSESDVVLARIPRKHELLNWYAIEVSKLLRV